MKRLGDFAEWNDATRRLGELQNELTAIEADHQAGLESLRQAERATDKLTRQAEAMLTGSDTIEGPTITEKQIEDLAHRRRVLIRAVELQKGKMARLQSDLSAKICQAAKPEYQKIVKRLAAAVKELGQAAEQERLYREDLADGGVSFTSHLPPLPLRGGWSRPAEDYGPVLMFTKEAKVCGYI